MLPITDRSLISQKAGAVAGCYYETKQGKRQKRPYNLNLTYNRWRLETRKVTNGYTSPTWCNPNSSTSGTGAPGCTAFVHNRMYSQDVEFTEANRLVTEVLNKARNRFVESFKGDAGLGGVLAERKQSMGMITNRASQMLSFIRKLRSGNLSACAEVLKITRVKTYTQMLKDKSVKGQIRLSKRREWLLTKKYKKRLITEGDKYFADLFLEFHFGWSPLVKQTYEAVEALDREIPTGSYRGRAKVDGVKLNLFTKYTTPFTTTYDHKHKLDVTAVVGATVSIKNANLALANQMGVVNPFAALWEVIPWSFLIDWFVNVQEWLNSFTEFCGYEIKDPYTYVRTADIMSSTVISGGNLAWSYEMASVGVSRVLSIPSVKLKAARDFSISPMRALTAVSLLIQQGFRK